MSQEWGPHLVLKLLSDPPTAVFGADAQSQRNRLLKECLRAAAAKLTRLEGPDPAKWSWGQLHLIKFRHSLDKAPDATALMDIGPIPRSGDAETVGATGYYGDSYEQVEGASYRQILDLSDWDKSLAVNTPGQSGQPASVHYSDLVSMWTNGDYFPLLYSRDAVEREATDRLTLEP